VRIKGGDGGVGGGGGGGGVDGGPMEIGVPYRQLIYDERRGGGVVVEK
jgi:hypothetical protein